VTCSAPSTWRSNYDEGLSN